MEGDDVSSDVSSDDEGGEKPAEMLEGADPSPAPRKPHQFQRGNRFSPGAGRGNTNGERHGLTGWLRSGSLPRSAKHVRATTIRFRELLEEAVVDKHSTLTITHAAYVSTAVRAEGAVQLLMKYLRTAEMKGKTPLELSEQLAIHDRVVKFSAARDQAIEKLKLDAKATNDMWGRVLDATPRPLEEPAAATSQAATDPPAESVEGSAP